MIILFSGLPRSGKTFKMVCEVNSQKEKYFVIHNIVGFKNEILKGMGFDWRKYCEEQNISVEEFFSKEYQSELSKKIYEKYKRPMLVVIDESHEWFDRSVKSLKMWLSYHGHLSQLIYLVAHAKNNISQSYKSFIDVEYRAKHGTFFFIPKYFIYNRLIAGERAGYIFEKKRKEIFALYKSVDVDSKEGRKKPSKLIPIYAVVIMLGVALFLRIPKMIYGSKAETEKEKGKIEETSSKIGSNENNQIIEVKDTFEEKYAYVGNFNGQIVVENRKNGRQYILDRVPGGYKTIMCNRDVVASIESGTGDLIEVFNFERHGKSERVKDNGESAERLGSNALEPFDIKNSLTEL